MYILGVHSGRDDDSELSEEAAAAVPQPPHQKEGGC